MRRSLALFCVLPSYDRASENRLTKGFKGPFVNLRAHSRVWMGSMLYKAFCLVYHGSSSNNRKHLCMKSQIFLEFNHKYIVTSLMDGYWRLQNSVTFYVHTKKMTFYFKTLFHLLSKQPTFFPLTSLWNNFRTNNFIWSLLNGFPSWRYAIKFEFFNRFIDILKSNVQELFQDFKLYW